MNVICENWRLTMKAVGITLIGVAGLLVAVGLGSAETGMSSPALSGVPGQTPSPISAVTAANENVQPGVSNSMVEPAGTHSYDPSGRRDPFMPVLQQLGLGAIDPTLPPLQRVGLTEMNLIAVIWGAYGNTAMVQTPDGNGYTVRRGTRIGPNNGVVSAVTEKGIVVQERFTDVYGSKQEREYVKLLHPKEGAE
ncbi:MAG TPA: pilus assembly protein PilP [Nitrospiraceae bacterium]|nr:pilus assembly protein PilP [Nitrospiraceae bacterium]